MIRAAIHFILTMLCAVVWGIGNVFYAMAVLFAVAADLIVPSSKFGNCWTYALPRWWRHGGYLLVRSADGVKFMNFFPVPHVLWVRKLPRRGVDLQQFVPVDRKPAKWFPLYTTYFNGELRSVEAPHTSRDYG